MKVLTEFIRNQIKTYLTNEIPASKWSIYGFSFKTMFAKYVIYFVYNSFKTGKDIKDLQSLILEDLLKLS